MEVGDLRNCAILTDLEISEFAKVYVVGETALILHDSGYLYGTGRNQGYLVTGQGNTYDKCSFTKIAPTVDKKFKDFVTKGKHALAITKEGFLYSWGSKTDDALGHSNGSKIAQVHHMQGIRIDKIACGNCFSLVLTMEGQLFEWGCYGLKKLELVEDHGRDVKSEDKNPKGKDKVQFICGGAYPVILSKKGKIYVPMLPRYKNTDSSIHLEKLYPLEGPLENKKVVEILEGNDYEFALTYDGEIHYWEISAEAITIPKKLDIPVGRPMKLWASSNANILVVADSFGDLYSVCWAAGGRYYSTSRLNFCCVGKYFLDIGVQFSGPAYVKQTTITEEQKSEIVDKWKEKFQSALNQVEGSDVMFRLGDKVIYAHKAIVCIQCAYLEALLSDNWSETNRDIKIEKYTYNTFLRFLQYLYSGKVASASHEENLELLQLAHEYMESDLLVICEKQVLKGILVENAISVYELAKILGLQDLLRNCKVFMSKHLEDLVLKEEFNTQEGDSVISFFRDMITSGYIQAK